MQVPLGREDDAASTSRRPATPAAAIGKWHVGGKGSARWSTASTVYHAGKANTKPSATEGGKGEYDLTAAAEQFIETNQDRPFLVYLAHNSPHIPYDAQAAAHRQQRPGLRAGLCRRDRNAGRHGRAACWPSSRP